MNFIEQTARALLGVLLLPASVLTGQNLIQNGGFESGGLAPWNVVTGTVAIAPYGAVNLPDNALANATGGGGLMIRDLGNGAIEQIVTPLAAPSGSHLLVEGLVGGGAGDWTRLVVRTLDSSGQQIAQTATPWVTERERNLETVLLRRELFVPITPTARSFAVRVEFSDRCCGAAVACADNILATVVTGSILPAPLAMNTNLLENPGFESGWRLGSPLTLFGGWEGTTASSCSAVPYANNSSSVFSGLVSCATNGAAPAPSCTGTAAGNYLRHDGVSEMYQNIDARGSTGTFASGQTSVTLGASIGGIAADNDAGRVEVRFLNDVGAVLASGQLGAVGAADRNRESVLVRRETTITVPAGTALIQARVGFTDGCCGGTFAAIDNVELKLVATSTQPPVQLNTNLVPNGSFEQGDLPGSPLQLNDPRTWRGAGPSRTFAEQYGTGSLPSAAFAAANGLGNVVLRDGGAATMVAHIDLTGSESLVRNNRLLMEASARLGGVGANTDTAEMRVRFETRLGVVTGPLVVLPAVTAAERQNVTTLLQRHAGPFAVPSNAATAIVELRFTDTCCGGTFGLADDIRLVAFDALSQASAVPFPGTDRTRLSLATGVDEFPRTGPGFVIKTATAGQTVRTRVGSPDDSLVGAPLLLAVDPFPTGQSRTQFFPDVWVDVKNTALLVYNGWNGGFLAPTVVSMSAGSNTFNVRLPNGLQGTSLMLQGAALPLPSVPSPNGVYFTTDAHEIRIQ